MYIELVRQVLEEAVETFAASAGQTVPEVLRKIRENIDHTAEEHRNDEPEIDYEDPLCRLGYLYRHAIANATLFEQVLQGSGELQQKIRDADQGVLRVCAVGGGPGTELLGIAKYLLRRSQAVPRKIDFTVLDNVPHWAETWQQLADAVEAELRSSLSGGGPEPPTIAPSFLPFDVLDPASYRGYAFQFRKADVVVFNYLFSENKMRLEHARLAIEHLVQATPAGCVFIVIDRLERDRTFSDGVIDLFQSVLAIQIAIHTYDGTLDVDEQTDAMGEMLIDVLGHPRVKFFTDFYRGPTVFWFAVERR